MDATTLAFPATAVGAIVATVLGSLFWADGRYLKADDIDAALAPIQIEQAKVKGDVSALAVSVRALSVELRRSFLELSVGDLERELFTLQSIAPVDKTQRDRDRQVAVQAQLEAVKRELTLLGS